MRGPLLLRREGYKVTWSGACRPAPSTAAIEINAHPMRLDIDWVHAAGAGSWLQAVHHPARTASAPWRIFSMA